MKGTLLVFLPMAMLLLLPSLALSQATIRVGPPGSFKLHGSCDWPDKLDVATLPVLARLLDEKAEPVVEHGKKDKKKK